MIGKNGNTGVLACYRNGNYFVTLYKDGTKVRRTRTDFQPKFPENIDLKITGFCDANCPMCHENAGRTGQHADLSLPLFDTLQRGTELAIGGGDPLSHPGLLPFLERMKAQGIICNLTVRQVHLFAREDMVQSLIDRQLIWGVGISLTEPTEALFAFCEKNRNCVIHLIVGIHGTETLNALADRQLKILLLGYKRFGRGEAFYSPKIEEQTKEVSDCFDGYVRRFAVISLDNSAMEALGIRHRVSEADFLLHFMGGEGSFTMYIDAVAKTFSVNSVAPKENRYPLQGDIREMFAVIRKEGSPI